MIGTTIPITPIAITAMPATDRRISNIFHPVPFSAQKNEKTFRSGRCERS